MDDAGEYAVVLPLGPLSVGRRISRAAWPLHVTLVPNVRSSAGLDVLVAVVRESARRIPVRTTTVLEPARFGPDGDIVVDLVDPGGLREPHEAVLAALETHAGAVPLIPAHHREGFRPHITVSPLGRAGRDEPVTLRTMALVAIGPGGRADLAVPVAVFDLADGAAPLVPPVLEAASAAALCAALTEAQVRHAVIGGWGVDALIGTERREHHDLDVLVDVEDAEALLEVLAAARMTVRYVWSENRWIDGSDLPSAFVADGPLGELDVHLVAFDGDRPIPLSEGGVTLPGGALDAAGTIAGSPVRCATAEAQLLMHTGYELPPQHRADVERLRSLLRPS